MMTRAIAARKPRLKCTAAFVEELAATGENVIELMNKETSILGGLL
jgi:hypothetical protein